MPELERKDGAQRIFFDATSRLTGVSSQIGARFLDFTLRPLVGNPLMSALFAARNRRAVRSLKSFRRFLIIPDLLHVGDPIMNQSALTAVRDFFPEAEVDYVVNEKIRIGGGLTAAALPHHRTYGSVSGGSNRFDRSTSVSGESHESPFCKERGSLCEPPPPSRSLRRGRVPSLPPSLGAPWPPNSLSRGVGPIEGVAASPRRRSRQAGPLSIRSALQTGPRSYYGLG